MLLTPIKLCCGSLLLTNAIIIEASQWSVNSQDFNIEFSLDYITKTYHDGVYTIVIWSKDVNNNCGHGINNDNFIYLSTSLLLES